MVKRCIGIDIGFSYLRAVQIMRKEDQLCIEKVFSTQTRRSKDSPLEILRQLSSKHGFDRRSDVAISMPHDAVFFRNLETDFAGLEQISKVPKSALEHNIPIESDQIVAQACSHRRLPNDKYSVLTAAVSKTSLHDRLNVLAEAKIHPNLVGTAIFAIHSTITTNHPEIATGQAFIAYIDESYLTLAVTENNNIVIVRNIPIVSRSDNNTDSIQEHVAELLAREAQVTWQKVFGTDIEQEIKIYLATGADVSGDLEEAVKESLRCQIVTVEPYAMVKRSFENNGDTGICVAEGLALRALAPEKTVGVNFLEADNADMKPALDLRKELIISAALVAAIIVVSFVGLFVRLFHLESKYTNIKNEIRKVFQHTLPQETNIVNPLVQLEQQLVSFRKDNQLFASFYPNNLTPLKVLHNITTNTPSESNIRIDDLLITTESVRLKGTCDSFDSVYQWQRLLQEIDGFTLVDVMDPQRNPKGDAIHFTILISLDRSPAIQEQK
ncbi:MAG: pilus assembly protein PilM [Planctomycetota bacterium]|jgi:Tfp pilus assembly PilM family ATPase